MFGPYGHTLSDERFRRYEIDRAVLDEVAPHVRHLVLADGSGAWAEGSVDVDVGSGHWEPVAIRIDFSSGYPDGAVPRVYDAARRWMPCDDRHLLSNHEFCLSLAHVDAPDMKEPDSLREFILRLMPFLRDQFVFDDLGRWPGPEWPHGSSSAYAQHLIEQLDIRDASTIDRFWPLLTGDRILGRRRLCPCKSGRQYGKCHAAAIRSLDWIRGIREFRSLRDAVRKQVTVDAT